jgi:aminopeptidase N
VLAVFFQSVSPNKFVGWGLMVLYLVASITFTSLGFEHNLYNFGGSPGVPLSDMNGMGHFWQARAWFDAYWTAFCLVLVVVSYGLWRRNTETRLLPRLKRLPRRLAGVPGVIMSTGLVTFTGLGGWIFYNTNILNTYQTTIDEERTLAEGEITLMAFNDTPQPTITRVELDVTLEPSNLRALTRGQYVVENKTGTPLREVHIVWQPELKMEELAVEGAARKQSFDRFNYTIWAFDTPMQPGEKRTITFLSRLEERGFPNARAQTRIVDNGSFINNLDISPQLGLDRSIFLQDRATRRKYGLAPAERMAKLEDQAANAHHYLRRDSDWVTSDITVTTDADQIPIAPGYQVSETRTEKTLTRRFRTEAPIMHFFSIQSARYAVKREVSGPVTMEVYYHPEHGGNVDRMLKAMRESLSVFSEDPAVAQASLDLQNACDVVAGLIKDVPAGLDELLAKALSGRASTSPPPT